MGEFVKYQHIERLNTDEVEGITQGVCFVFPKIDGTNGTVWMKDGELQFGSRNRDLSEGEANDNQGFREAMAGDSRLAAYFQKHPDHRLYGEWLVPHTLKTYREDAWRKFYVFDVAMDVSEKEDGEEAGTGLIYLPYTMYRPWLDEVGLDFIPLLAEVRNGSDEQFYNLLEQNTFLVKDGAGVGEGIVIKNYSYRSKYGRTTFAKIVRSEFKTANTLTMGAPIIRGERMVETEIVERFCTDALIEKEYAKIAADGWSSKMIPKLLGVVFYCLITECSWEIVKELKMPTVNYKALNRMVIERVKEVKKELFA